MNDPPAVTGTDTPNTTLDQPALSLRAAAGGSVGPITFDVQPGELLGVVTGDNETAATIAD